MDNKKILKRIKYSLRFLPDKVYIKLYYYAKFKKLPNLKNPKTFNEKLNWLKLYDRNPIYSKFVDKLEAKEYVSKIIGSEFIIPTIDVFEKFDDIDFDKLPKSVVLKCTHDSEGIAIIRNKDDIDIKSIKSKIETARKTNFYYIGREWPYKKLKPRILVEKYMNDKKTNELRDYKFFCFNGKIKFFKIDFNRETKHQANYFDCSGKLLKFGEVICPPDYNKKLLMPKNLDKMIELAEKLSKNIPFIRVDFYEVNDRIFFGELTLYPASGFGKFIPDKYDLIIGNMLDLKCIKEK